MKGEFCIVCKRNREGVERYKTIKGTYIMACPNCTDELDFTKKCMAVSVNWALEHRNSEENLAKVNNFTLTPIDV